MHKGELDRQTVRKALELLQIDEAGLTASDRKILETIVQKFSGGPVGLSTVAAAISEEESTVEEVHEPYLMQLGLLERTPRGRMATKKTYEHLGLDIPEENQERLL